MKNMKNSFGLEECGWTIWGCARALPQAAVLGLTALACYWTGAARPHGDPPDIKARSLEIVAADGTVAMRLACSANGMGRLIEIFDPSSKEPKAIVRFGLEFGGDPVLQMMSPSRSMGVAELYCAVTGTPPFALLRVTDSANVDRLLGDTREAKVLQNNLGKGVVWEK